MAIMALPDLIAQFRYDVADKALPYLWTDDEVTLWFNEAVNEAAIRARLIREDTNPDICVLDIQQDAIEYPLNPLITEIVYISMVYPGNPTMIPYVIGKTTTDELDQQGPAWRALKRRPTALIINDTNLRTDCIPDTDYTMNLEVYRLPLMDMVNDADVPEINGIHHIHLVKWVKHRAYERQDADTQDMQKSTLYEKQFTDMFGERPSADLRKRANANRPHRNRAYA